MNIEMQFNAEQSAIVDGPDLEGLIVLAVPGAGKTSTLIRRLQHMRHDGVVFVVAFNSIIATHLQKQLDTLDIKREIHVGTFHSLAFNILCANSVISPQQPYDVSEIVELFHIHLKSDPSILDNVHFMVDEIQDLDDTQFEVLQTIYLRARSMILIGDNHQCVYGWRGADSRHIDRFYRFMTTTPGRYIKSCKLRYLSTNYRSTAHIINICKSVIQSINADEKLIMEKCLMEDEPHAEENDERPTNVRCAKPEVIIPNFQFDPRLNGRILGQLTPIVVSFPYYESQFWFIRDYVRQVSRSCNYNNVAIISRFNKPLEKMAAFLKVARIPYTFLGREGATTTGVNLMTVHAAKGLEYKHVIVLDLNPDPRCPLDQERILFYVALSRAQQSLCIMNNSKNNSIFVTELSPSTYYHCSSMGGGFLAPFSKTDISLARDAYDERVSQNEAGLSNQEINTTLQDVMDSLRGADIIYLRDMLTSCWVSDLQDQHAARPPPMEKTVSEVIPQWITTRGLRQDFIVLSNLILRKIITGTSNEYVWLDNIVQGVQKHMSKMSKSDLVERDLFVRFDIAVGEVRDPRLPWSSFLQQFWTIAKAQSLLEGRFGAMHVTLEAADETALIQWFRVVEGSIMEPLRVWETAMECVSLCDTKWTCGESNIQITATASIGRNYSVLLQGYPKFAYSQSDSLMQQIIKAHVSVAHLRHYPEADVKYVMLIDMFTAYSSLYSFESWSQEQSDALCHYCAMSNAQRRTYREMYPVKKSVMSTAIALSDVEIIDSSIKI